MLVFLVFILITTITSTTTTTITVIYVSTFFLCAAIETDANANSSETMEDFERSIFGDLPNRTVGPTSFYQKFDQQKTGQGISEMMSRLNGSRRSGYLDGLDDGLTTLTDGLDGKLKDAATYFEYDVNEVEKEDYKFRPDVTFWPGNTYDVKVWSVSSFLCYFLLQQV